MFYSFVIIDSKVPQLDWTEYRFILIDGTVHLDTKLHYQRKNKRNVERIVAGWARLPATDTRKWGKVLEQPDMPSHVVLEARKHLANLPIVEA